VTGQASGHIGVRIKAARQAKALSQDDLAVQLGVRGKTIRRWEHGKNDPQPKHLRALSATLDCSLPWLLEGEPTGDTEPAAA
jgi:transcriptional regulator with XRE-family HTH domain